MYVPSELEYILQKVLCYRVDHVRDGKHWSIACNGAVEEGGRKREGIDETKTEIEKVNYVCNFNMCAIVCVCTLPMTW